MCVCAEILQRNNFDVRRPSSPFVVHTTTNDVVACSRGRCRCSFIALSSPGRRRTSPAVHSFERRSMCALHIPTVVRRRLSVARTGSPARVCVVCVWRWFTAILTRFISSAPLLSSAASFSSCDVAHTNSDRISVELLCCAGVGVRRNLAWTSELQKGCSLKQRVYV